MPLTSSKESISIPGIEPFMRETGFFMTIKYWGLKGFSVNCIKSIIMNFKSANIIKIVLISAFSEILPQTNLNVHLSHLSCPIRQIS